MGNANKSRATSQMLINMTSKCSPSINSMFHTEQKIMKLALHYWIGIYICHNVLPDCDVNGNNVWAVYTTYDPPMVYLTILHSNIHLKLGNVIIFEICWHLASWLVWGLKWLISSIECFSCQKICWHTCSILDTCWSTWHTIWILSRSLLDIIWCVCNMQGTITAGYAAQLNCKFFNLNKLKHSSSLCSCWLVVIQGEYCT